MTTSLYKKKCSGCGKEFTTPARNARYAPSDVCKCLERRKKHREKRRRERRLYWKNPDKHRALALTRSRSRQKLIDFCKENGIIPGCETPDCKVQGWDKLKQLDCHHRDHNPFNLYLESYPTQTNLLWHCRTHHEHADRAQEGKGSMVLYSDPPKKTWLEFLIELRETEPKVWLLVPSSKLYVRYTAEETNGSGLSRSPRRVPSTVGK